MVCTLLGPSTSEGRLGVREITNMSSLNRYSTLSVQIRVCSRPPVNSSNLSQFLKSLNSSLEVTDNIRIES